MKKIRQGQSKWYFSHYPAGRLEGYDVDVCVIGRAFITAVRKGPKGLSIYYDCHAGPYISGENHWRYKKFDSYRQAYKAAQEFMKQLEKQ